MTLRDLLGEVPVDVQITGLAYDNRAVEPGFLFFCVPGFTRDGHDFAPDAVERGAAALVVARPLGLGVPEVLRRRRPLGDGRRGGALPRRPDRAAARRRDHRHQRQDDDRLPRALAPGGRRPSVRPARTVKSVIGGEEHAVVRTTPEAIDLQRTFAAMEAAGDRACAMEISSHALELRRADGIHVAAAVFTNLTQDHLDFHPDMEAYFQAKRLLFASPLTRARIANADDEYGRRLAEEFAGTITFGLDDEARTTAPSTSGRASRARASPRSRPTASSPCGSASRAASTCSTRSARGPRRG